LFATLPSLILASWLGDGLLSSAAITVSISAASIYLLLSVPLLARPHAWAVPAGIFAVAVVLNAGFIAHSWSYGVRYQGRVYSQLVLALNVLCVLLIGAGLTLARRRSSARNVALCQMGLFCWLNWVAFPWFGEML
jgi:hypothetical protein